MLAGTGNIKGELRKTRTKRSHSQSLYISTIRLGLPLRIFLLKTLPGKPHPLEEHLKTLEEGVKPLEEGTQLVEERPKSLEERVKTLEEVQNLLEEQ